MSAQPVRRDGPERTTDGRVRQCLVATLREQTGKVRLAWPSKPNRHASTVAASVIPEPHLPRQDLPIGLTLLPPTESAGRVDEHGEDRDGALLQFALDRETRLRCCPLRIVEREHRSAECRRHTIHCHIVVGRLEKTRAASELVSAT